MTVPYGRAATTERHDARTASASATHGRTDQVAPAAAQHTVGRTRASLSSTRITPATRRSGGAPPAEAIDVETKGGAPITLLRCTDTNAVRYAVARYGAAPADDGPIATVAARSLVNWRDGASVGSRVAASRPRGLAKGAKGGTCVTSPAPNPIVVAEDEGPLLKRVACMASAPNVG